MLPILSRTIGGEFMDWQFYLLFFPIVFLYGICIGSFLNVLIYRLPNNESLIKRSSHCMTCQAKIRKRDLIPVFSWLFLRGKCHILVYIWHKKLTLRILKYIASYFSDLC